jgi:transposase
LRGKRTVSELAAVYDVHPRVLHQWKKSLLEGAGGTFERGDRSATAEVGEDVLRGQHAKIGD